MSEYLEIKFPEQTTFYVAYNDTEDWVCGYVESNQDMSTAKENLIQDITDTAVVAEANAIGIPVTLDEINGVLEDIGDE